jgi:tRNA threonylcarbamoyladenosine biosynthesis protein TsaB
MTDRPLLAIEMSQRGGSVALGTAESGLSVERFDSGGSSDSDPLLPTIDRLVRSAGLRPADIGAVAVSVGPGGFTGLRISVTAAKCMSEALGIPLVAVPSALVAVASTGITGPWLVALASKQASVWMTAVGGAESDPQIVGEPAIVLATEFSIPGTVRTLLADEYVPADLVSRCRDHGLTVESPRFDASGCWRVGAVRLARGLLEDAVVLAPIYPREPEAVSLWRSRHAAG